MIEIRIHGRGGQGNVVAAYLLATAAFEAGLYCQAFPAFGAERRGAPVVAFVRIGKQKILRRNEVKEPAFLIIQDPTLLHEKGLTTGLMKGGGILVNTKLTSGDISAAHGEEMIALPATGMAVEAVGRPVPNVALLSAFLSLTGIVPHTALRKALSGRFKGEVLDKNLNLVEMAAKAVDKGLWKEVAHAASA
ncbi:MAG: 2-oxoacid:acceptor oxidoreductase family protein [Rhodobacterales bacterium]|nr:2-oxoacid:acceptor oxidoreductase family protein [Rhodobacterales bacterium]